MNLWFPHEWEFFERVISSALERKIQFMERWAVWEKKLGWPEWDCSFRINGSSHCGISPLASENKPKEGWNSARIFNFSLIGNRKLTSRDLRGWERRQWGLVTGILLGLEYIKEPLKRASRWKCSPTLLMKHIWPLQFCCSRNPLSMPQLFRALLKWSLNRLLEWLNFPLWWLLKWNWTLSAHLASPGVSLDTSCLNSVLTTSQLGSLEQVTEILLASVFPFVKWK